MKKTFFLLILSALFMGSALADTPYNNSSEEATDFETYWMGENYTREQTPSYKLGRGLTNIFLGWTELIFQPRDLVNRDRRWPQAILEGLVRGVFFGVGRTVIGAYEVATFPIPIPRGYLPLIYPESPIPIERDEDRHFYPRPR